MVQHERDAVAPGPRLAFPRRGEVADRWSPITIVAAISSRSDEPAYPTDIRVDPPEGNLRAASVVLLNQLRSIDRRRLLRRLGRLRPETIKRVDRALQIGLGLAGL
jgi:mRNA interferase MazF